MSKAIFKSLALVVITGLFFAVGAQQHPRHGQHQQQKHQDEHHAEVNRRGDQAMGFAHDKTTHHFTLLADGGIIDVSANAAQDSASREQIRKHLAHIAMMFAEGNFSLPMFIHAQNPPGAEVMKEKRGQINYQFAETERGARVRIVTADAKALAAVHEFLRFQIKDHKTGDSLEVKKP